MTIFPFAELLLSLAGLSVKSLRLSIITKFVRGIILLAATAQSAKRNLCLLH
jgi:hypothetical protein